MSTPDLVFVYILPAFYEPSDYWPIHEDFYSKAVGTVYENSIAKPNMVLPYHSLEYS